MAFRSAIPTSSLVLSSFQYFYYTLSERLFTTESAIVEPNSVYRHQLQTSELEKISVRSPPTANLLTGVVLIVPIEKRGHPTVLFAQGHSPQYFITC
jgi:hypothetical protein